MDRSRIVLILFAFVSIVNIASVAIDWQTGIYFSKPLIMISLSFWFWEKTKTNRSKFSLFILLGLMASIAGDSFLMFTQHAPIFFLLGLGSFLIAHLFYITAFIKKGNRPQIKLPVLVPILIYLSAFIYYLLPDLPGDFKIPVIIYGCVISTMLLLSISRNAMTRSKTLALGAALFVLSDSIIAIGKFKELGVSDNLLGLAIMITYIFGQYLIAKNSSELNEYGI